MSEKEYLRTEEAARLLNVHTSTIKSWIHSGRLPSARIGKLHRIPRRELEALVRERVRKTNKISIANQKGGVAKTTTTINLAAALVVKGKKVLVVDLDPQGGCSVMLGYDPGAFSTTLYNVLLFDEVKASDAIIATEAGFDLLPSNIDLAAGEFDLKQRMASEQVLRFKLSFVEDNYDYILLDCPPSLGVLTVSAFNFASEVLIPMSTEQMALRGLQMLVQTIEKVRSYLNPDLQILGVLPTRYRAQTVAAREVMETLKAATKASGVRLFGLPIKESVRFTESPSARKPMVLFDPTHEGSKGYMEAANEILETHA